jgi:hypothetical protein
MAVFSLVFTISVIGFGNTFYILAISGIDYETCDYPIPKEKEINTDDPCIPFTG